MKAIVWTRYGSPEVLQLQEVEKPTPQDDEVLIRVRAVAVTAGDCEMRRLDFPFWLRLPMRFYVGFRKPSRRTILGMYLAGEIEAVGNDVTRFTRGDQVFAATGFRFGANAEYVCLPEAGALAIKPANMTYEEAAAVPLGGLNARHFLRKANIQSGEKVLINGAGGSIGTFAVQLAKLYGAEVTGVDSAGKFDMLRSIGADHVVDYTQEDFTKSGETYDVILDVVAGSSFSRTIRSLKEQGRYLMANPRLSKMVRVPWVSMTSGKRVILEAASETAEGLVALRELIEAGKIRSVIDRRYPLEQTVEAHRYVETGQKVGDVVIVV